MAERASVRLLVVVRGFSQELVEPVFRRAFLFTCSRSKLGMPLAVGFFLRPAGRESSFLRGPVVILLCLGPSVHHPAFRPTQVCCFSASSFLF